jgi:N-acetylmuramoyl-L-alanine amidase
MFLDYYQLSEQPFGAASRPAQVYGSRTHSNTLESARKSLLDDRGDLALIAEAGMGKTTLLHQLLESLRETGRVKRLFHGQCNSLEILQFLLREFAVDCTDMDLAAMRSELNKIWFAEMLAGKRVVLIFDDAENLDDETLETLQSFSKYETSRSKLLQIVLSGQANLLHKLDAGNLTNLRKRIADVLHLEPLSPTETAGYIRHRLYAAGRNGKSLFAPDAMATIAVQSQGIPKNINKICSRALLEAYARGLHFVSAEIVEKAEKSLGSQAAGASSIVEVPSINLSAVRSKESIGTTPTSQLTYKVSNQFGLPSSGLWVGAVLGVLLSAGLALPHGILRGVSHIMHGTDQANETSASHVTAQQPISNADHSVLTSIPQPSPSASSHLLAADAFARKVPDAISDTLNIQSFRFSLTRELGLKINRIVIDPGHGGFDTGAKGPHGLLEKDLCLAVAFRLGQMIEQNIPGAEVIYTRKDDSYVPLEERTAIANKEDADLFISIHANSSNATEVRGVETFYLSLASSNEANELAIRENALTQSSLHDLPDLVKKITRNEKITESKLLASEIQSTLSQRLQLVSRREKNRGVKQAPFIVLAGANMPAVLSEISFVTNATDENLLQQDNQRQRIADGLYRGIAAYLDGLRGTPQNKQKLVTDNRSVGFSAFDHSTLADTGRNPL